MAVEMFLAPEPWPVVAAATQAGLATIGPPQPDAFVDPDTWMARFGELPLLAQPGQRWLYNTGAHVLSVLCARAVGISYDQVLRTRIFEPLGMRDTGFWTEDVERLATAYQPTADGVVVWDPPNGQWSRPPAFPDGAAGLVSTVDDLLAFARMLLRGGDPVLTADQVREMSRDHLTAEQREFGAAFLGGRGWGLGTSVVLHGPWAGAIGWDGGLGTSFLVHPARDLAVIVLTQRLFETRRRPRYTPTCKLPRSPRPSNNRRLRAHQINRPVQRAPFQLVSARRVGHALDRLPPCASPGHTSRGRSARCADSALFAVAADSCGGAVMRARDRAIDQCL